MIKFSTGIEGKPWDRFTALCLMASGVNSAQTVSPKYATLLLAYGEALLSRAGRSTLVTANLIDSESIIFSWGMLLMWSLLTSLPLGRSGCLPAQNGCRRPLRHREHFWNKVFKMSRECHETRL